MHEYTLHEMCSMSVGCTDHQTGQKTQEAAALLCDAQADQEWELCVGELWVECGSVD
jgi:hypothetical protein